MPGGVRARELPSSNSHTDWSNQNPQIYNQWDLTWNFECAILWLGKLVLLSVNALLHGDPVIMWGCYFWL